MGFNKGLFSPGRLLTLFPFYFLFIRAWLKLLLSRKPLIRKDLIGLPLGKTRFNQGGIFLKLLGETGVWNFFPLGLLGPIGVPFYWERKLEVSKFSLFRGTGLLEPGGFLNPLLWTHQVLLGGINLKPKNFFFRYLFPLYLGGGYLHLTLGGFSQLYFGSPRRFLGVQRRLVFLNSQHYFWVLG